MCNTKILSAWGLFCQIIHVGCEKPFQSCGTPCGVLKYTEGVLWGDTLMQSIMRIESKSVFRCSQHGFSERKSFLMNLIAFYDDVVLESSWWSSACGYIDFSEGLVTVSHSMFAGKLRKHGLDDWIARQIAKPLKGRSWRVLVHETESSWNLVSSGVPWG